MNRIHRSPLPAFPGKLLLSLLTAFSLLAGTSARSATEAAPTQQTVPIDSHQAAKLLIHIVKPDYPAVAKVNFIEGAVKLEIRVNKKGRVEQAHVVTGEPLLAAAAVHAVRKWRYRPYVSKHGTAPFITDVVVRFDLHRRDFWHRFPDDPEGFLKKQVRPPKVIARPDPKGSARKVPVKVLVDSDGKVLDVTPLGPEKLVRNLAREDLKAWKFQPAQWGTLTVPWYITVHVPLGAAPQEENASAAGH